jgi:hypothetical protein
MNKLTILAFLVCISFFSLPGCKPQVLPGSWPGEKAVIKGIVRYDATFMIDPGQGIFQSQMLVTLTPDLARGNTLTFYLDDRLVIDHLALKDTQGNELPLKNWQKNGSDTTEYWWGKSILSEIKIQTKARIPNKEYLLVEIDYHLPPELIQQGRGDNIYSLFVSPQESHAGGPESGAFPMVSGNLEAPFRFTIQHPNNLQCVLPGEQVGFTESNGYITDTYEAKLSYDPSFTCAPYHVMQKKVDGVTFEIFAPVQMDLSPQMLEDGAAILSLYNSQFGHPSANSFRIVFLDLENSQGGGESNGNLVFVADSKPYLDNHYDEKARSNFSSLVGHEGYHLWNVWSLKMQGTLTEWWVEGGANFMTSWANESLYGAEAGAQSRLNDLEAFNEQQAYTHKNTLASLDENWFDDWALVYCYGAMVWEQLRQAVGSEALMTGLREFYTTDRNATTGYDKLVLSIQHHTPVDVAGLLNQWTQHNATIDLSIHNISTREVDGRYQVALDVQVKADRDYEIFTTLGYKTITDEDWQLVDLHLTKAGLHQVVFESDAKPVVIQVDPEYRVPQINLEDNTWVE